MTQTVIVMDETDLTEKELGQDELLPDQVRRSQSERVSHLLDS